MIQVNVFLPHLQWFELYLQLVQLNRRMIARGATVECASSLNLYSSKTFAHTGA